MKWNLQYTDVSGFPLRLQLLATVVELVVCIYSEHIEDLNGFPCGVNTECYSVSIERTLCWVTVTCFQSTHPLTLLKSGTVTVSKRLSDMSTREVCGVCMRVCLCVCMCVFVGACGVSGSASQWVHLLCFNVYVINTNRPTLTQHLNTYRAKAKEQKRKLIHCIPMSVSLFISLSLYFSFLYVSYLKPLFKNRSQSIIEVYTDLGPCTLS